MQAYDLHWATGGIVMWHECLLPVLLLYWAQAHDVQVLPWALALPFEQGGFLRNAVVPPLYLGFEVWRVNLQAWWVLGVASHVP